MKKRSIALVSGIIGLAIAGGLLFSAKKTNLLDGKISSGVYRNGQEIELPTYNPLKLGPLQCSRYTRMAARDLFGKQYHPCDAWERRYLDKVVGDVRDVDLRQFEQSGNLLPGMIVGMYNPKSQYNGREDFRGKKIEYTHNALYIGKNPQGELVFAEQRGRKIRASTLSDLEKEGLKPIEVIDSK